MLGIWFLFWCFNMYAAYNETTRGNNFIAISPQPNVYDFSFLAPCPTSGQVVYSDNDELVTKESIIELDNRIKSQKGLR